MKVFIVEGDLLDQQVEVIVNPWNRNLIPWWLLIPQGVSGAIRRHGGHQPFIELAGLGPIPLGEAVETSAGRLPHKAIIHVAGINVFWRSNELSIRSSVRNVMRIVLARNYNSVAFPLIGAGTGGKKPMMVVQWMQDELSSLKYDGEVRLVKFVKKSHAK